MKPVPNFFLVGAPKAGTTSFLKYLEQHPAIFVSAVKEPGFFAPEILTAAPDARGIVREWNEYLRLFEVVRNETAIGEGTVAYLASESAAERIRSRLPDARIMMILRDPADRLRAYWGSSIAAGVTSLPFRGWVEKQLDFERNSSLKLGPIWTGFYANDLKRYLNLFPSRQIKPIIYDDYVRAPHTVLRETLSFLNVDPDWQFDLSRRHNVTQVPRWPLIDRIARPLRRTARALLSANARASMREFSRRPSHCAITPEDRALAIEIYREDIRKLASVINRDLSAWLSNG